MMDHLVIESGTVLVILAAALGVIAFGSLALSTLISWVA